MNIQSKFPATSLFDKRLARLMELINDVNEQIESSKRIADKLGVKQYLHLRSQYLKELVELLSEYGLTVYIKEAEVKEAA